MNYQEFDYEIGQYLNGLLDAFWEDEETRPLLYRPDEARPELDKATHFVSYSINHVGYEPATIGNADTATKRHSVAIALEIWTVRDRFEQESLETKAFFQSRLEGQQHVLGGGRVVLRIRNLRSPAGTTEDNFFVSALYIDGFYDILVPNLQSR